MGETVRPPGGGSAGGEALGRSRGGFTTKIHLSADGHCRVLSLLLGIAPKIARRGAPHGSGLGKTRWVVERTFAWLHQFKRLRIRYEMRADLHLGLLQLACGIICLRNLRAAF